MKVFISHASPDKPLVRRIVQALEDAEVDTWLDEADIRVGESIPEGVTAGLLNSDLLVLAFSQHALKANWVKRELHAFFMMAMSSGKPILPCRLDDSTPPALIADIKYADFRDDFEFGMRGLLGAVGIAEEIASAHEAANLAESLESQLSEDERRKCYGTWVKQDSVYWSLMDQLARDIPEQTMRVVSILEKFGLVEDIGRTGDYDITYVATPLGKRVFAHWAFDTKK